MILLAPPLPFPAIALAWAKAWARRAPGRRAWGVSMCSGHAGATTSVSVTPPGCTAAVFLFTNAPWGVVVERTPSNSARGEVIGAFPDLRSALLAVCPLSPANTAGADREARARVRAGACVADVPGESLSRKA